jgi:hypothetical protein
MPANYHPLGISIDEDPAGQPVIAYQGEYQELKLARPLTALGLPAGAGNCGPEELFLLWYCDTIDPYWPYYPGARQGDFVSLVASPSGLAYIAYQGFIRSESSNLRVAYQQPFRVYLPLVLRDY